MLKKCLAVVLAMILVFSCGMMANAQEDELTLEPRQIVMEDTFVPLATYISKTNAELDITNGIATCYTGIEGKATSVYRVDITMTLQKKTLLWWSDVETWSSTTYDYKASMNQTASVGSGTYRVKAVCTVHYSAEEESTTIYSTNASA